MEIKQEASEKSCKIERVACDGPMDAVKIEIKEEPKRESAYDAFDYLDLNKFPLKTEVEPDEYKFKLFEDKQTTNEEGRSQEKNRMKIIEMLHSSHKAKYTGQQAERKILHKHRKVVTGQRLYKCEICLKQLSRNDSFARHMKIHTGEKPYKCQNCLKQFSEKGILNAHLKVHSGEKPGKKTCEICFKKFTGLESLKNHLRVHTGEKPYKCEHCLKKFSQKGNLKVHLKIHTEEKPYKCEVCFKKFTEAASLRKHWGVHIGEKPYQCEICFKAIY
ncbi:unnamed protein product [Diabrotica balteata]|uniref:Protein krueppel n=1 Tax=Diabrotica balteata TaxID=107213 RepID=A0A9N9X7I5_DIABA|nr:unnamed protein product [Diabrotica balteata]